MHRKLGDPYQSTHGGKEISLPLVRNQTLVIQLIITDITYIEFEVLTMATTKSSIF
jgi:hypothetical protein